MSGAADDRLRAIPDAFADPSATDGGHLRLLIDLRPLQKPERAPITAAYLAHLVAAMAARPGEGEEIMPILRALRADPLATEGWPGRGQAGSPGLVGAGPAGAESYGPRGLALAGRRVLPPTARLLRSAGALLEASLLRTVQIRSAAQVYHSAGGTLPAATSVPVVAALLDLAPWELPERYAASPAARLARMLRTRGLRAAARILVVAHSLAEPVTSLIGVAPERISVVPLAADASFGRARGASDRLARLIWRLGLPARYLVVGGRYDARSDLRTVLQALSALRHQAAPAAATLWPPRLVLMGAAAGLPGSGPAAGSGRVQALVEHFGLEDLVTITPRLSGEERALLESGAAAHVQAALSDAAGLPALDALAAGVPVLGSRAGCLPEIVGAAGIIVEPRDVGRMASAMRALWEEGPVGRQLRRVASERAAAPGRTWSDVAAETRAIWREVAHGQDATAVYAGTR